MIFRFFYFFLFKQPNWTNAPYRKITTMGKWLFTGKTYIHWPLWTGKTKPIFGICWFFSLVQFVFYSIVPYVPVRSGSTALQLYLLTADFIHSFLEWCFGTTEENSLFSIFLSIFIFLQRCWQGCYKVTAFICPSFCLTRMCGLRSRLWNEEFCLLNDIYDK